MSSVCVCVVPASQHGQKRYGPSEHTTCHSSCTRPCRSCPTGTDGPGSCLVHSPPIWRGRYPAFIYILYTKFKFYRKTALLVVCSQGANSRSTLHLHRVASLWEVPLAQFLAVRTQIQAPAGKVPLFKQGHLTRTASMLVIRHSTSPHHITKSSPHHITKSSDYHITPSPRNHSWG